jgi:hypothetical protein
LISFAGFLLLARLPDARILDETEEFDHRFVITLRDEVSP